jgi:hypothetical protein
MKLFQSGRQLFSGILHCEVWWKLTDVSEMLTAFVIRAPVLLMEAISTAETSLSFCQTTRHPENTFLLIAVDT